jgi:uncharacterized protein YggL (DUF469 family)
MKRNAKNRSRRLRKKLRVDEFQKFGFATSWVYVSGLSESGLDVFLDNFIDFIEANGLCFGGGDVAGFVAHESRGSVSE